MRKQRKKIKTGGCSEGLGAFRFFFKPEISNPNCPTYTAPGSSREWRRVGRGEVGGLNTSRRTKAERGENRVTGSGVNISSAKSPRICILTIDVSSFLFVRWEVESEIGSSRANGAIVFFS